jgi:L-arabinokinase
VSFFEAGRPVAIARAPGRLDVMGGIADYSGSLVLQLPLAAAATATAQLTSMPEVVVRTTSVDAGGGESEVRLRLADLVDDYAAVRARFGARPERRWAGYIAGAITVLHLERNIEFTSGVRWLLNSAVPAGKGVSSSAAIEVAAMHALAALLPAGTIRDARELALLCQRVENLVVGAPCGVMDQMTAAAGRKDRLLALLCQPAELQPDVDIPHDVEVIGIDSGIRHEVTGADYSSVRAAAFMGRRIIDTLRGESLDYLANVGVDGWEARYRDLVPERLRGADFLREYGASTDAVTTIDPARTYAVRQATAHPIHEHARVCQFRTLLETRPLTEDALRTMGELMYASHASYSACGLGSSGTDRLVEMVRAAGPARGLYGAKITGGGSGGTVAVLARRGSRAPIGALVAEYTRETGRPSTVLSGSSDGAVAHGIEILVL